MGTRAPGIVNPDDASWYVPVIGMGGASIIGRGMESLKATWADVLRLANKPLTTENIASMAGGINAGGPAGRASKLFETTLGDVQKLSETDPKRAEELAKTIWDNQHQGAFRATSEEFKNVPNAGGMVPDIQDQDVLTLLRNAIGKDQLGFGK